jgi:hypothetical protein
MEGKIQVRMTSHSTFGGTEDILRFTGHGTAEETEYGWHLIYTVENITGGDTLHSDVKIEREGNRVVLVNGGENGYGLLLDEKTPTVTQLREGGKALTLNVRTKQVRADLKGKHEGSLLLEYMLLVGMQPVSTLRVLAQFRKEDEHEHD